MRSPLTIKALPASVFLCIALAFTQGPAPGFVVKDGDGQSLHGKIVKEALSSTLDSPNLNLVISCLDQKAQADAKDSPPAAAGSANQYSLKSVTSFVDREQKKILNYAAEADVSPASRYHCLKHLGQLLLVAEDFYSRSDYVEVQSARLTQKLGKAGFDPYNIELVDWNKLFSALKQNEAIIYGPAVQAKEDAKEGKAPLASTTYFKTARELAVRETSRQWEVLETLIKQRYHERAITILAALKQASCPSTEPEGLE